jgi:N-methylhydantoinase B
VAIDAETGVLWDRLVSAVNEASRVLQRSAFSTLVRECNDFACTLMTPWGETVAVADIALPSFAATQSVTLRACLERRPVESWRDGDILITNDAWIATGHVLDLTILKPVFVEDRLVAFTGSVAHSPDLGGVQRWSASSDVFEEGLQVPPLLLYEAGRPDQTLFAVLRANSRRPGETIGDLMAQIAANETTERRVRQIMHEHGLATLDGVAGEILSRSEASMRAAIAAIPNGDYEHEMHADGVTADDGGEPEPITITTRLVVRGDEIDVTFADVSPQQGSSINSTHAFTASYVAYALRLLLVPHMPQNGGFTRPLQVRTEPGSVLAATFPAPTLNRTVTGHLVCDGVFGALSGVLPDRVWAMSGSTPIWVLILVAADGGDPFHRILLMNGGLGANEGTDGEVGSFPANLSGASVELVEAATPVLVERKELIPDSAGPGRYRGGHGVLIELRALRDTDYSIAFNRVRFPPQGLLGGQPGRGGRVSVSEQAVLPGASGRLRAGTRMRIETPGGGGIGPPSERSGDRVRSDFEAGLLSDAGRRRYEGARDDIA